jgi:hypothetical protein
MPGIAKKFRHNVSSIPFPFSPLVSSLSIQPQFTPPYPDYTWSRPSLSLWQSIVVESFEKGRLWKEEVAEWGREAGGD